MAEDDKPVRKRSRFDQTESSTRSSRFDRRSRSPQAHSHERRRSQSPHSVKSPTAATSVTKADPAAAAAAAAARINAQLQSKKGIQSVDVPPIRATANTEATVQASTTNLDSKDEVYVADGDYIKDIEVNDLRNRYTLTKGSTQKMIKDETGADVTTRGEYYPDKSMATAQSPPLYLHVTSTTKEGLDKALQKIEEMMKQELPNLIDERRFRRREPEQVERDEFGRRKWPEERIAIGLEPIQGFNLRAQIVGQQGAYVKHIQQETRCRVQIKGRGSGFTEHGTNQESDEPMYLHVAGPDAAEVQRAKELCISLLDNVRTQYERYKENPPHRGGGSGHGGYGHHQQQSYGGYGQSSGYGSAQSPTAGAPPGTAGPPGASGSGDASADYAAQYAQYYGGQDPYAAYGGYQNYVAYYQYYQQQAAQQQEQGHVETGAGTAAGAPPPPPGDEGQPPPPPPGAPPSSNGGFNSVPPPPGL